MRPFTLTRVPVRGHSTFCLATCSLPRIEAQVLRCLDRREDSDGVELLRQKLPWALHLLAGSKAGRSSLRPFWVRRYPQRPPKARHP